MSKFGLSSLQTNWISLFYLSITPCYNLLFCQLNLLQSFKKFLFFFQFRKLLMFRKDLERIQITNNKQNGSIIWTQPLLILFHAIDLCIVGSNYKEYKSRCP